MKTNAKPCKPGNHERTHKRQRVDVNYHTNDNRIVPIVLDTCGKCGMWRWALRFGLGMSGYNNIRGPFSQFLPAKDRPRQKKKAKAA